MNVLRAHSNHARRSAVVLLALSCLAVVLSFAAPAQSAPAVNHTRVVSAVPGQTPAVNNGATNAIVQVGNIVVVGGTFTNVTPVGGAAQNRNYIFAFNVTTGALVPGFNPTFNGTVNELLPGPTSDSVYVGGGFTQLGGVNTSHVTLLNVNTGAVVGGFKAAATNGVVNSMAKRGTTPATTRLILGGNFTTAGGVAHAGLAAVNATTGALDGWMNAQVSGHHNDSGSGAQGAVGVRDIDVSADGSRLVAIGNFKRINGILRDQIAMFSLTDATSVLTADWATSRYSPYCFSFAFDTYMRGVSFSPDGSYLVVAATGGHVGGTLCDTASRFETNATGTDVQPTWVNYSGGDTLWAVTATEKAVYVGGHQRWMNNSLASDQAGPGSVPRPGLAALNTATGVPLKWNPGRNPRGAAVYALYATSQGLWMGSDTEYIGNHYQYKRPRLAFFPHASGAVEASDATTALPGTAYLGANPNSSNGNILYRINAGGGTVGSADNGPDWVADDGDSPYRNDNSNAAGWGSGATQDGTVPSTTPNAVFDSERWSPNDSPAMEWDFAAPVGAPLEVRLYFANRCDCTGSAGLRSFDVSIDGVNKLDNFDIVQQVGDQRGTMRAFDVTSDGNVDIDFAHEVENPLINAIEIVRTDMAPPAPDTNDLRTVPVSTGGADPGSVVDDGDVDWTTVRGSFVAGGKLYYGKNNGTFNSRSYNDANGTFGSEVAIDPYNDPNWAGIDTGSGNTYDGEVNSLYGQMGSVAGMAYTGGKLYYVRNNDGNLYWRWFNADSGIIGADEFTANGGRNWTGTGGMFAANGKLYFVTKTDGNLNSIDLTATGPSGASSVHDGPVTGDNDWRARALFLVPGNQAPANTPPTAAYSASCIDLVCTFNGSGSTDAQGPIASYAWDFGHTPNGAGSGQSVSHTFPSAGTYPVKLTVTDGGGLTNSKTTDVTVSVSQASPIIFRGSTTKAANVAAPTVNVPGNVEIGDTLVLTASMSNATSASAPAGWSVVGDTTSTASLRGKVWVHTVAALTERNQPVPVTMDAVHKAALVITAYNGVSTAGVTASPSTDAGATDHATPQVTVPAGSWVVWAWGEKTATSNTWTTTPTPKRADVHSSASSAVSKAVADTNGARTGVVPGATSSTATATSRGVNWSIVLPPQ